MPRIREIRLAFAFAILASVFISVSPALGQATQSAAAGTMIAAGMETAGYHAQAQVLDKLSDYLQYSAALMYLGVLVAAVFSVVISGEYRGSLWVIVGPPLFFFASGLQIAGSDATQVEANGAEWRFGAFEDSKQLARSQLDLPIAGGPAKVSMVFHQFNLLVSETTQKLIEILTNNDIASQMIFMARQKTIDDLFGSEIQDPGVLALTANFLVQCDTELSYARNLALGRSDTRYRRSGAYKEAREKLLRSL